MNNKILTLITVLFLMLASCQKSTSDKSTNSDSDTYIKYTINDREFKYIGKATHNSSTAPGCRIDPRGFWNGGGGTDENWYTLIGQILDSHDGVSFGIASDREVSKLSVTTYSRSEWKFINMWFPIMLNDGSPDWKGNDTIYKKSRPYSFTITKIDGNLYSGLFNGTAIGWIEDNKGDKVKDIFSEFSGEFKNVPLIE